MMFSVGIPAYKISFLKECINSILSQTYNDFELIIINDASPEDVDSIVNTFNDSRIRYYKNKKNFGAEHVVDNWNKCLSYAQGDYFVLMGDDDKLAPDYLEVFSELIIKYPSFNVFHCRTKIINERSEVIDLTDVRPEIESVYDNIWHRISGKRIQFISDYVLKREPLIKNGGFYKLPLAWASDDITVYQASIENGIISTNKPVFYYRKSGQNISSTGGTELKLEAMRLELLWINSFLTQVTPNNEIDLVLHKKIYHDLISYKKRKTKHTLLKDKYLFKLSKLFYGLNTLKKHRVSVYAVICVIVLRIKKGLIINK